jgi:hypothetical protein
MLGWIRNHRGPFIFCVNRHAKKPGLFTSEWLKGEVEREDIPAEALALLTDPRDGITYVGVWSESEQSFVGGFALRDVPLLLAPDSE